MSRSRYRPKPKRPGDGCFLCDPVAQENARRRHIEKQGEQDTKSDMQPEAWSLSTEMKTGDLVRVRVFKQPNKNMAFIEGSVGLVEEVQDTYAQIKVLHSNGDVAGWGSVPLDCLKTETAPEWVNAAKAYQDKFEKRQVENEAYSKRYHAMLDEVGAKYGISPKAVEEIYGAVYEFRDNELGR